MMVQDRDIWRAAGFLTREHGAAAKSEAARRADLMLFRGDLHGLLAWMRIARAIEKLQAPPVGKPH